MYGYVKRPISGAIVMVVKYKTPYTKDTFIECEWNFHSIVIVERNKNSKDSVQLETF